MKSRDSIGSSCIRLLPSIAAYRFVQIGGGGGETLLAVISLSLSLKGGGGGGKWRLLLHLFLSHSPPSERELINDTSAQTQQGVYFVITVYISLFSSY